MRSLNNLLERFHQSYFFYLLPSTDRYVSIGKENDYSLHLYMKDSGYFFFFYIKINFCESENGNANYLLGLYMRPLVLIIAGVFIKAFSIWQRLQTSTSSDETKKEKSSSTNKVLQFPI